MNPIIFLGVGFALLVIISSKSKPIKKILFVGDSLTAATYSYADQVKSLNPSLLIKKIAVVGKKTDWMRAQLQAELQANQYDLIVIWGGVNDIYATGSTTAAKANLAAIFDLATEAGAKVTALTIIPTATYPLATNTTQSNTVELNQWIKTNTPGVVIDAFSLLNNGWGGTASPYLQPDKLHLTPSAHGVLANQFNQKSL